MKYGSVPILIGAVAARPCGIVIFGQGNNGQSEAAADAGAWGTDPFSQMPDKGPDPGILQGPFRRAGDQGFRTGVTGVPGFSGAGRAMAGRHPHSIGLRSALFVGKGLPTYGGEAGRHGHHHAGRAEGGIPARSGCRQHSRRQGLAGLRRPFPEKAIGPITTIFRPGQHLPTRGC
jgi:hypothetical protein